MTALHSSDRRTGWSGHFPVSWPRHPLKRLSVINQHTLGEDTPPERLIRYVDISSVSSLGQITGIEPLRFGDAPSRARRIARPGDVLVSTVRTYLKAVAPVSEAEGEIIASTGFAVVTPDLRLLHPQFLAYWLRSSWFVDEVCARSTGVSYPATNPSEIGSIPAPCPPLALQGRIAEYLTRETAVIDGLLAEQQSLLGLLAEKRAALIHQAVTRGVDPGIELKKTPHRRLGWCPMHWHVHQLRRGFTLQRGVDITSADREPGNVPVVSSGGVAYTHRYALSKGPGVVVGRKGSVGTVHYVDCDYWPHDTTLWVDDFKGSVARFVYYVLLDLRLETFDTGSANPTVNRNLIHPTPVAWPPEHEQRQIASYLDAQGRAQAELVEQVRAAITLLQERRQALITAAVTGQIDPI